MRISIAQLNFHVGNFEKNISLICNAIDQAKSEKADLVIFSELSVTGYPPLDLLDNREFIEQANRAVLAIAEKCKGITAIVGAPIINTNPGGKKLFNSALVLSEGKIVFTACKALLPTYDIFDEYRHFEPAREFGIYEFMGKRIAITVCEDLWDEQPFDNPFEKSKLYTVSPMDELAKQSPDIVVNISASPFSYSRSEARRNIFRNKALKHSVPVIAVNQTGSNTELIFDGSSLIVNCYGKIIHALPPFTETVKTYSFDEMVKPVQKEPEIPETVSMISEALVTGTRDYFRKSGFTKAILGLSGGIDSAVTLCIAAEALGKENVKPVLLPSKYSSDHSVTDSVLLCQNLGIGYEKISIEEPVSAFDSVLSDMFRGLGQGIAEENIQSRTRAVILMAIANKFGYILLNTSNKSEAAVGYGTLYGDMAGGLSVIGDVYKTDVYRLARHINRNSEIIPQSIIEKAPSAELRPGQFDTDSLPGYDILDPILYRYIELLKPAAEIIADGFDEETVNKVIRLININEYKRYQAPPVLRISSKAFGAGRRLPIVAKY